MSDAASNVPPVVPPAAPVAPKTSGWAVASLVCGILGLLLLFPLLLGILFGIVALIKIGRSQGRLSGAGFAIGGIAISFLGFFFVGILAAIALPAMIRARDVARRTTSAINMKELGRAADYYVCDETGGKFPDDPAALSKYVRDARIFRNPRFPDQKEGYVWVSGLSASDDACVLAYENVPGRSRSQGRNVLLCSGVVRWVTEEEFLRMLADTEAHVKQAGGAFKTVPVVWTGMAGGR